MDIEGKLDTSTPDLGRPDDPPPRKSFSVRVLSHASAEVSPENTDLLLLLCSLASGLTDSTLYNAYNTFVSMQTGNTIFVALGASNQNTKPYGWARSLCSIGFFILGSLFFSRLYNFLGPRCRRTLVLSFLIQTLFVMVAAAIVEGGAINGNVPNVSDPGVVRWNELAPVAMLSFQSAGQIVTSRALALGEIPTVVITSLLCDLMSDTAILAGLTQNIKRNRRIAAFTLTLVGAIAGGWISKATKGVEAALWVVMGIKFLLMSAWIVWPKKTVQF
ncbi:uncharacterized protein K452DRAFT_268460 [Aplosporella prunicola CBS 121167]|uniref:DUF1275 domain protein n=1 Tax=Aplosporella prunicola CBS 121167 TaxID=1176127 RepID=A0A6A6BKV2_9PEZI|nr:uncharacterized protein K452DRAFT_268460 [Aplosporella prunicola CBS 121167]KAF2143945.1 hypothetical protein K452DRAFT_268460 [Aplosporella prunicola CBS 121167]